MNKIKAQIAPYDSFSPWQESFINLVRSFDPFSSPGKAPLKRQYLTIDGCKGHQHEKNDVSKRGLGRSILNLSKINLRSSSDNKEEQMVIQQKPTKYQGPRLTFYSKMNPSCSQRSKKQFKSIQNKSLRYSFYDSQRLTFLRDKSIKYLEIQQENNEIEKSKNIYEYIRSVFPTKGDKDCIYSRKNQEKYHNMRRLKILSNNRKLSHQ